MFLLMEHVSHMLLFKLKQKSSVFRKCCLDGTKVDMVRAQKGRVNLSNLICAPKIFNSKFNYFANKVCFPFIRLLDFVNIRGRLDNQWIPSTMVFMNELYCDSILIGCLDNVNFNDDCKPHYL